MERKQIFQRLKARCVELIQVTATLSQQPSPKKELVQCLIQLLRTLEEVAAKSDLLDPKLAEFVFVPISHVLRVSATVPVHALELCLGCISILLRTGWKRDLSPELSTQLLILFTFLANPSSADNGIPATSEELQTAAFKCMADLLTEMSAQHPRKRLLTATANIPMTGKAVLVIVDSLAEGTSNDVRLAALAALKAVCHGMEDQDALASFLPRMVSSLTKVLTPTSAMRASFRVLELGLETLSLLLLQVLSDRGTKNLPTEAGQTTTKGGTDALRTTSWLQATAAQMKLALANVFKLRQHDKKEVRHALFQLCLRVIQDCRKSLSESTSMAIETLVALSGRSGENDVVESDLQVLVSSSPDLASLLRESLHGWVISLPRLMQSKDDEGRRQVIHRISVTLRILQSESLDLTIVDDLLAANLRDGVANILGDSKGIGSIIEATHNTATSTELSLSNNRSTLFPALALRLKGQDDMMREFSILLRDLAKTHSAIRVAQDLITTLDAGTQETRLASLWLSVNLVRELIQENAAIDDFLELGTENLQAELLDELYSLSLSKLTASEQDSDTHWHFKALFLEIFAMQAMRYKEEFRVELIEALYPVLHLLGSSNPGIQGHAMTCLNIFADSCGYSSASDLIVSNVDYIVNAVALKLNYHDISPQAPQVLLMMMRLSGPSLLPYLDDLVGSMFSALERYHGYPKLVELLFSVLRVMTEEGVKAPQLAITEANDSVQETQQWKPVSIAEVVSAIKKLNADALKEDEDREKDFEASFPRRPWKDPESQEEEPESDDEENDEPAPAPESKPPAPKTFDILLKISNLTQHYLTSSSPSLRTSLLSLLYTTIPALAKHEDSFLPLINTLWPVILPRLEDPEAYVVSNALDIIALMCTHAGNFMRGRIEGTWEELKRLHRRVTTKVDSLEDTRVKLGGLRISDTGDSVSKALVISDSDSYRPELYVEAPSRMIRESLVGLLCSISRHVAVREDYFDDTLDMLDLFLTREDVRSALECRNPDAVWLRLHKKRKSERGQGSRNIILPENPKWAFVEV